MYTKFRTIKSKEEQERKRKSNEVILWQLIEVITKVNKKITVSQVKEKQWECHRATINRMKGTISRCRKL